MFPCTGMCLGCTVIIRAIFYYWIKQIYSKTPDLLEKGVKDDCYEYAYSAKCGI